MLNVVSIDLKSNDFTLLVIHIRTMCIGEIRLALMEKIQKAPHFFSKNTPIVVDVSKINYSVDWPSVYQTILNAGLLVIGVCCCYDDKLKNKIINSGLPILNQNKFKNNKKYHNFQTSLYNKENILLPSRTQIIYTPVRSGQTIYARNTDLVVIANVSFGAEIIADGNIHIYGITRGRVLAGASGDKKSQIFCTNLFSEFISIGGHYWLSDQIPQEFLGKSVRLYLKNNDLIIRHIL